MAKLRDAFQVVRRLGDAVLSFGKRLRGVKRSGPAIPSAVSLRSDDLALRHQAVDAIASGEPINTVGGAFAPDLPFDGTAGDPGLDPGLVVTDGAFTVNGKMIQVFSEDSLDDVIGRINLSAAGVIAEHDADAGIVRLRGRDAADAIDLGPDSSGFLAAVKLDGVLTERFTQVTGAEGIAIDHPATLSSEEGFFDGVSTATALLSGAYEGSADDTLTFRVARGGAVGDAGADIAIDVFDKGGTKIARLEPGLGAPVGTEVDLGNGLGVTLTEGELAVGDEFTVEVGAAKTEEFDPDSPLSLAALGVGRGVFELGGAEIEVLHHDSLSDVLTRINQFADDVEARWDPERGAISLRRLTPGALEVSFGDDSTGFVAAFGLDAPETQLGHGPQTVSDADAPISSIASLGAIRSGTMQINGVGIGVDIDTDSVEDLIARITTSGAGVRASLSEDGNRLLFESTDPSASLILDDGDTRFFDALGIREGSHAPEVSRGKLSSRGSVKAMEELVEALSDAFAAGGEGGNLAVAALKDDLTQLIGDAFSESRLSPDALGLHFDAERAEGPFRFWKRDQLRFRQAMSKHPERFSEVFLGEHTSTPDGLIQAIVDRVDAAKRSLADQGAHKGLNLDVTA